MSVITYHGVDGTSLEHYFGTTFLQIDVYSEQPYQDDDCHKLGSTSNIKSTAKISTNRVKVKVCKTKETVR